MKKPLLFFFFALWALVLVAQPANDDCAGIVNLGTAPVCPSAVFTNLNATESNIGNDNQPGCFNGPPARDVWFQFTATADFLDYLITVKGAGADPILMPQIALYRGDVCLMDELVLLGCADAVAGESAVSLQVNGLTPGLPYFLRINDWTLSTPNWGSFEICVEEYVQTTYTIDQGGASTCSGELYDTGGPNGNYGNNETHIFTICPDDPHGCILFNLVSYELQNGGDFLTFFDGPNVFAPIIGQIDGGGNGANHGGVCYSVAASSGCLTLQFTSNGNFNYEGFYGTWTCTSEACPTPEPLSVTPDPTAAAIEQALESPVMDVAVTNVFCPDGALGTFQATDQTGLGMNEGLLLTTGLAGEVSNPASVLVSTNHNATGDPDLDFLHSTFGNGVDIVHDGCVVEMDVTPKWGRVGFDYVFGSDEYKQTFSPFSNDLMAILISGPGIPGMAGLNNQENIGFLPGNVLVDIQNVNAATRWEYFRNNEASQTIAYNGLTSDFLGVKKTISAVKNVTPCQTYHVKLAIGDTDENDDSGLFVRPTVEGIPVVEVEYKTGIDYLVEGCTNVDNQIHIKLPHPISTTLVFQVQVGGTATPNVDYLANIPVQVIFQPGETDLSFPISVLSDNIAEGTETIELRLATDFGCGEVIFSQTTLLIKDELSVQILPESDTVFVCDGVFTADLSAEGAASYAWSPGGVFDDPNAQNVTATIAADQWVSVAGTLGSCTASDSVFLKIVSPQINISQDDLKICAGETVALSSTNNVQNAGLIWEPSTGLDDPTSPNPFATPAFTTTYTARVETASGNCTASDEITITVEPFDFPKINVTDTLICQNSSVVLAEPVPNTSTTFEWTPADGLNATTIPNPTATPDVSTTYTLVAMSQDGFCVDSAEVHIEVLPADVEIQNPDVVEICLGDSIQLTAITSTGGAGLTWSPADSLSSTTDEVVIANPMYSTWYYATLEVGDCVVKDSVYVRVDSLPDLAISAIPDKDMYCEGEIISLVSEGYAPGTYPDISHVWIPAAGAISADTLFNFVFNATETTTYVRYSSNHACSDTAQFEIVVVPTAEITITPEMPTVCPGGSVQLVASSPDITEFEWSPGNGLSCTDCPNPVATPPVSITYQVSGEFMGCPSNATVFVELDTPPVLGLTTETTICDGESVVLNTLEDPDATYVWTLDDGTVFSNEPMPEQSPTETTTYHLSISKNNCPPIEKSVTIEVIKEADLTLTLNGPTRICLGDEVSLSAQIETSGGTFDWSHDSDEKDAQTTDVPGVGTTVYTLTYTSPRGCFTRVAEVSVEVAAPFVLDSLTADPICVFEGGEIALEATTTPSVLDEPEYTWQLDGANLGKTAENFFTLTAPVLDNADSVEVILTVFVLDAAGCSATAEVPVTVKNSYIALPNAFTPDNDNLNERFNLLRSDNVTVLDFRIWNRWGKLVYDNETNDLGWDGTISGEPAPSDVYVYYIRYQFGEVEEILKGELTLLR